MNYVKLGAAGVKVSALCLGSLNFGWRTPEPEAVRIIHAAMDAGLNFIDSASCFSREAAEEIVGRALAGRRDQVILAAKLYAHDRPEPGERGNGRRHLLRTVDAQLRRLQTDHIDLYYVHPDAATPLEETFRTLSDLVFTGKVRYIGLSHFPAWQVVEALALSERLGLARVIAEQPFYHLLDRRAERDLLPMALHHGVAVMPHSPLANGMLSGRYRLDQPAPPGSRGEANRWPLTHPALRPALEAMERFRSLAAESELELPVLALAWLLDQPGVTAPVIGPRTAGHLTQCLQALEAHLPDEIARRVDQVVWRGQRA